MIHPLISNRVRLIWWWLIWLLIGTVQSLLLLFLTDLDIAAAFLDGILSALIFSILALAVWFPLKQLNSNKRSAAIHLINHLIIAVTLIALWLFSVKGIVISLLPSDEIFVRYWKKEIFYRLAIGLFTYALIVLVYYLLISIENIKQKSIREANLEKTLKETELLALRSQINPHFLFNSLNSISSLTVTNPEKAREMIIKLSDLMRYALSRKEEKLVPLDKEINNLKLYIDLEKVRFGDKLVLEEKTDSATLATEIPNMILQPLYENAIKHGVYESTEKVIIRLETLYHRTGTLIRISNNYDPEYIPRGGTGTGLRNVRRRLDLYYDREASLVTKKENGVFIAEVYIPSYKNK